MPLWGILMVGTLVGVGKMSLSVWESWQKSWLPETQVQVPIPTLVVERLRQVKELHTVTFTSESLIPATAERTIGELVVGKTELLYLAYGEVRAGIDLTQLDASSVQASETGIEIILPPAQILDSKIDVHRSRVYHYHRGFLNLGPDQGPELQSLAQRRALQRLVATACSAGVLEQANDETRTLVSQLFQDAGYDQIQVKTQPPICSAK